MDRKKPDIVFIGTAIMDAIIKGFEPEPVSVTGFGRDAAGDIIASELAKHQVDTSCIVRSDEHATPITTMFVADDGSRKSITNSAHRYNFHPEMYSDVFAGAKAAALRVRTRRLICLHMM